MAAKQLIGGIGRRKTATARVVLIPAKEGEAVITVNKRDYTEFFSRPTSQMIVRQPLELVERLDKYSFRVNVRGGGSSGQAAAVRHGISRALIKNEPELRGELKKAGFLTRDARIVERKKPGRHKARKKPQFSKR